jgi:hypothetical protein
LINSIADMGDGAAKGPGRCQGLTVWSLEGQEYPQDISYIGAPDMLSELAPEMDAIADRACSFQCQYSFGRQTYSHLMAFD